MMEERWKIISGNCIEVMASMPEASIDSIICDPPYSIAFMSRTWDSHDSPQHFQSWCESWAREALRVAKPGAWLLAFGGTRTSHRLTCGIEDAGWEIRDSIALLGPLLWAYGSGYPKSLDVSKAIDKAAGAQREAVRVPARECRNPKATGGGRDGTPGATRPWIERAMARGFHEKPSETPATDAARQWEGWGTALKPSHEPIIVARKPLAGTVAENVQRYGTGALNIAASRIGTEARVNGPGSTKPRVAMGGGWRENAAPREAIGRWPANLVLIHAPECVRTGTRRVKGGGQKRRNKASIGYGGSDAAFVTQGHADADGLETVEAWSCVEGCPVRILDEQSGERPGGGNIVQAAPGTASRFFARFHYTAKADSTERQGAARDRGKHPTVKPLDLMRWLVRLVTPPGGLVLDPFSGSGTTVNAALLEGFRAVGIEQDAEMAAWSRERIAGPLFAEHEP